MALEFLRDLPLLTDSPKSGDIIWIDVERPDGTFESKKIDATRLGGGGALDSTSYANESVVTDTDRFFMELQPGAFVDTARLVASQSLSKDQNISYTGYSIATTLLNAGGEIFENQKNEIQSIFEELVPGVSTDDFVQENTTKTYTFNSETTLTDYIYPESGSLLIPLQNTDKVLIKANLYHYLFSTTTYLEVKKPGQVTWETIDFYSSYHNGQEINKIFQASSNGDHEFRLRVSESLSAGSVEFYDFSIQKIDFTGYGFNPPNLISGNFTVNSTWPSSPGNGSLPLRINNLEAGDFVFAKFGFTKSLSARFLRTISSGNDTTYYYRKVGQTAWNNFPRHKASAFLDAAGSGFTLSSAYASRQFSYSDIHVLEVPASGANGGDGDYEFTIQANLSQGAIDFFAYFQVIPQSQNVQVIEWGTPNTSGIALTQNIYNTIPPQQGVAPEYLDFDLQAGDQVVLHYSSSIGRLNNSYTNALSMSFDNGPFTGLDGSGTETIIKETLIASNDLNSSATLGSFFDYIFTAESAGNYRFAVSNQTSDSDAVYTGIIRFIGWKKQVASSNYRLYLRMNHDSPNVLHRESSLTAIFDGLEVPCETKTVTTDYTEFKSELKTVKDFNAGLSTSFQIKKPDGNLFAFSDALSTRQLVWVNWSQLKQQLQRESITVDNFARQLAQSALDAAGAGLSADDTIKLSAFDLETENVDPSLVVRTLSSSGWVGWVNNATHGLPAASGANIHGGNVPAFNEQDSETWESIDNIVGFAFSSDRAIVYGHNLSILNTYTRLRVNNHIYTSYDTLPLSIGQDAGGSELYIRVYPFTQSIQDGETIRLNLVESDGTVAYTQVSDTFVQPNYKLHLPRLVDEVTARIEGDQALSDRIDNLPGASSTIIGLTDTPSVFGPQGSVLKVNAARNGMVFESEFTVENYENSLPTENSVANREMTLAQLSSTSYIWTIGSPFVLAGFIENQHVFTDAGLSTLTITANHVRFQMLASEWDYPTEIYLGEESFVIPSGLNETVQTENGVAYRSINIPSSVPGQSWITELGLSGTSAAIQFNWKKSDGEWVSKTGIIDHNTLATLTNTSDLSVSIWQYKRDRTPHAWVRVDRTNEQIIDIVRAGLSIQELPTQSYVKSLSLGNFTATLAVDRLTIDSGVDIPEGVDWIYINLLQGSDRFEPINWKRVLELEPATVGQVATSSQFLTIGAAYGLVSVVIRISHDGNNGLLLSNDSVAVPTTLTAKEVLTSTAPRGLPGRDGNDIDIHSLTEETPNQNAEFLLNKHTPLQHNFLYEENQRVTFQRDGATNDYYVNLPPPNAVRHGNTKWGDADGTPLSSDGVQTIDWSEEVYVLTDGFIRGHNSNIYPDATETDLVLIHNGIYVPFSINFHIAPQNNSIEIVTPSSYADLPSDLAVIIDGTSYSFFTPATASGRKTYASTTFTGLADNTDFTLDITGTDIDFGRGEHGGLIRDLWSGHWDTNGTGFVALDIRPESVSRFTSTDISTLNDDDDVTLDLINKVETLRGGLFYLKGSKHTHNGQAYLLLDFFNDAALTDKAESTDIHADGFNRGAAQTIDLNFRTADSPAINENVKTGPSGLASLVFEAEAPVWNRLQNQINQIIQQVSQVTIEGFNHFETTQILGSLYLSEDSPEGGTRYPSTISVFSSDAIDNQGVYANIQAGTSYVSSGAFLVSQVQTTTISDNFILDGSLEEDGNQFLLYLIRDNYTIAFAGVGEDWQNFRDFSAAERTSFSSLFLFTRLGDNIRAVAFSQATRTSKGNYQFPDNTVYAPNGTDDYSIAIVKNTVAGFNSAEGTINGPPQPLDVELFTYSDTLAHQQSNSHKFVICQVDFSQNKNNLILQIQADGDHVWDDIASGSSFVPIPVIGDGATHAYYFVELKYQLGIQGTIRLVDRSNHGVNSRFLGAIRTPYRTPFLTTATAVYQNHHYFLPGEVVYLDRPQGISGSSITLTAGSDSNYFGWARQSLNNFVSSSIGALSEAVDSELLATLVEQGERKQIYVIGESATYLSTLTHFGVDNIAYPLSSQVRVSGGIHFKLVEDGNGNPLTMDDSPLNDLENAGTKNIFFRKMDGSYIGTITSTFEVGHYERQETSSSDLTDIWKRVYFIKKEDRDKLDNLPDLPIKRYYKHGGNTQSGIAIHTTLLDDQEQFKIAITPRHENSHFDILINVNYEGDTTGDPDDAGIRYKVFIDTTQIGKTRDEYIDIGDGNLDDIEGELTWHRTTWPNTTDEVEIIFYANRILHAGGTSMPIHIREWDITVTEYPPGTSELIE